MIASLIQARSLTIHLLSWTDSSSSDIRQNHAPSIQQLTPNHYYFIPDYYLLCVFVPTTRLLYLKADF